MFSELPTVDYNTLYRAKIIEMDMGQSRNKKLKIGVFSPNVVWFVILSPTVKIWVRSLKYLQLIDSV